jgi:uncharacterized membrane protein
MPEQKDTSSNTLMAVLCYFGILVLIPLVTDAKNDPFVKFHIKQGLALLIVYVICFIFLMIPVIGWLLGIFLFVLFIMGVINAATGKQNSLPVIGQLADKIKI